MKNSDKAIADIKKQIKARYMTIRSASAALGIHENHLGAVLRGEHPLSADILNHFGWEIKKHVVRMKPTNQQTKR